MGKHGLRQELRDFVLCVCQTVQFLALSVVTNFLAADSSVDPLRHLDCVYILFGLHRPGSCNCYICAVTMAKQVWWCWHEMNLGEKVVVFLPVCLDASCLWSLTAWDGSYVCVTVHVTIEICQFEVSMARCVHGYSFNLISFRINGFVGRYLAPADEVSQQSILPLCPVSPWKEYQC